MGFFGKLFGGGRAAPEDEAAPATAPAAWVSARGAKHPWIMGCQASGVVVLEAGAKEVFLVVLPVADRKVFDEIDKLAMLAKVMKVKGVIVCNAGTDGHLVGSAIARATGQPRAYAIDPGKPIDRGGEEKTPVEARPFVALIADSLHVQRRGTAVFGTWRDGATLMCGHPMSFADLAAGKPDHVIGKLLTDGLTDDGTIDVLLKLKQVVIPANVPGYEAKRLATMLSRIGVGSSICNGDVPGADCDVVPEPVRMRVLALMTSDDLDGADALAVEAIADGEEVDDMHHQRAMIALMRGDEAAAEAHLAKTATPQAMTSRAIIGARRSDPAAPGLALEALAQLPGDAIAIRAAIMIHALAGDRAKARAILAEQKAHLDAEVALALGNTIDDPPRQFGHNFPEHASLVFQAAKPLVDRGDYASAEPLLRRAAKWDPEHLEIACDLGFVLSKLKRDDDAIAVYDAAIARGGSRRMLHFNRGNCQLRRLHYADAVADFKTCVELMPDWHDARVNLASALFASGDKKAAREEIDRLKQRGGPPQHVKSLEQMLQQT